VRRARLSDHAAHGEQLVSEQIRWHLWGVVRSIKQNSPAAKITRVRRIVAAAVAGMVIASGLVGCGVTIPTDPDGTLAHVRGGVLRVGVSPDPGLVAADRGTPSGPLVDIAEGFAESIDARPRWTVGSEETLVGMLEDGDLDLLIGGFTADSPWFERAGMTRGYTRIDGADGRRIVLLLPLGENAFLTQLETYLDEEVGP
jgi:hypothetical protein